MEYVFGLYLALLVGLVVFYRYLGRRLEERAAKKIKPVAAPLAQAELPVQSKPPPAPPVVRAQVEPTQVVATPIKVAKRAEPAPAERPKAGVDLGEAEESARRPAIQGASRPVKIDPDHFKRHSGKPGFLYLARNDERREHLYKIGYTTLLPQGRIKALSDEVAKAIDIGSFRLLHSVPVGSSYDMEQALFAVLAERRVVEAREFFYGHEQPFIRAMDALVRMPEDNGETVNDFLASNPWGDLGGPPPAVGAECPIPARSNPDGGWLYVCQNYWHKPGTFYFSVTKETPSAIVKGLNEAQRTLTTQLGFYRIVACRAVDSTETARQHAQLLFAPYKTDSRKQFLKASLDVVRTIVEAVNGGVASSTIPSTKRTVRPTPATPPPTTINQKASNESEFPSGAVACGEPSQATLPVEGLDKRVSGEADSWQRGLLDANCESCGSALRYQGQRGTTVFAECPRCQRLLKKVGLGRFS